VPFEVYLAGRATHQVDGKVIPVTDIAERTSRAWLGANPMPSMWSATCGSIPSYGQGRLRSARW
jgi:hypothetical protein